MVVGSPAAAAGSSAASGGGWSRKAARSFAICRVLTRFFGILSLHHARASALLIAERYSSASLTWLTGGLRAAPFPGSGDMAIGSGVAAWARVRSLALGGLPMPTALPSIMPSKPKESCSCGRELRRVSYTSSL